MGANTSALQIYISQFKSDYGGVKSKGGLHIFRSHLEKKRNSKTFKNGQVIVVFDYHSKKIFEEEKFGLKIALTWKSF